MSSSKGFEIIPATTLPDVELLRPELESSVIDHTTGEIVEIDVEDILDSVPRTDEDMGHKHTIVAWSPNTCKALGMMSLVDPDTKMRDFAQSLNPIELTNAYILSTARGLGIGRALVRYLEGHATSLGFTEIILNSGPRFRLTGHGFWRTVYGEPIGIAKNYYGQDIDAPVWHKLLEKTE